MQSNSRKYGKKEKVVDALNELKAAGIGDWIGSNTYSFDRYGVADRVADSDYQAVQPF
jgi:aryl-alcohol dehydrogenase-like predicted oxidoreductase